jgi:aryl-alcohol dehydrogenase-like predicted oxidoreductase
MQLRRLGQSGLQIVSATSLTQLADILKAAQLKLTRDDTAALDAASA